MSGSRRNRMLNLNAPAPLPNHHAPQPSHQQDRPLPHAYQQLPAPANDSVATAVPPRPMVIQYAVPHHPPSHHESLMTRPQYPTQIQIPMCAPPPQSPTHTRTNSASDLAMERLSQALVAAIAPSFVDHEKSVAAIVKKVEGSIEKFAADVKEARSETDNRLFQLTEAMHKSLQIQSAHIKATNKRTERIEALFMATFDRNDEVSLVSRLENIQYTVGELSERVKDPGAQDFFILPHLAQTANAAETGALLTPPESIELPSTLVQRIYEDKATFCHIPEPPQKRAQSPIRPIYKDVASDAMNLEPESSAMASLIQLEYKNVGNGPRTPSPPCQLRQTMSPGPEPSSYSTSDRTSTPNFQEKLSEVTAEFGIHNGTETLIDAEEVNSSLGVKRQPLDSDNDAVEDSIVMAHPEGDDSMIIDIDTSMDVQSPVESEPGLNNTVTDVEARDDTEMDDERKSEFSAQATIEYLPTFTSRLLTLDDESVVVPQETVCSSSGEPNLSTPSQEQRSLPSPVTTPSAPASPKLSPPANFTTATTPSLQFTEKRPFFTVSSPTCSSKPEFAPSLPKPDFAISVQTPLTPETAPLFNVNMTPYSDDGSEIAVSYMVTDQPSNSPDRLSSPVASALEHAEQPQNQMSPDDIPLFFPSKSQSPSPLQVDDASSESPRPFSKSPPPEPEPSHLSPPKSQSARPTTPVVKPTSSMKTPATIFNTPFSKLKSRNSGRNSISVVSTPQKTQTIKRPVSTAHPHISPRKKSAPEPIVVHSSPIFVPSRSPSPLSIISSSSEQLDSGHDSVKIIRKKQHKKDSSSKVQTEPGTSGTSGLSTRTGSGSESVTITIPRRIDLSQKVLAKKGESAALTRVKKRKAPTAEQLEPPLKRARQKALAGEVEREMRVKHERLSLGLPSVSVSGNANTRGKEKVKEKEKEKRKEDDKGYKLPTIKTKTLSAKEEKKLRPRALPLGVNWPEKNTSGNKKFDQQFIECEKCYLWYHYGCIGIVDLNDAIAKGEKMFICPPCTGGGANPMLPSDNVVCARPDCDREEKKENEYFMTAILGRHTKVSSGVGRKYMWLVKWDGYPIRDCTWEEEDGMSDPQNFIQDFYRKATREGKDPDEDPHSTILLRDAIAGGWTDPNA